MIDIHSHIIPGIDDGAKDIEMAVRMIKIAERAGTKKLVVTPHFIREIYECEYNDITKEVEKLRALADANRIDIEIYQG